MELEVSACSCAESARKEPTARGESSRQVRQNVYIAFHALAQQGHIGPQIQ